MSIFTGAAAVAAAALIIYATLIEPYAVRVSRMEIPVPDLPEPLDGVTICHLTDTHLSRYGRLEARVAELIALIKPDLCALTGDLVNTLPGFRVLGRILSAHTPRLGIYASPGNGDYRLGMTISEVADRWIEAGITPLINAHASISVDGAELLAVGVGDPYTCKDDIESAMAGTRPESVSILLAHSPDVVMHLGERRPVLILCGHTHGGQARIPCVNPVFLHCRYHLGLSDGLYSPEDLSKRSCLDLKGVWMYVSRGISSTLIRFRLTCPPEIAVITLRLVSDEL